MVELLKNGIPAATWTVLPHWPAECEGGGVRGGGGGGQEVRRILNKAVTEAGSPQSRSVRVSCRRNGSFPAPATAEIALACFPDMACLDKITEKRLFSWDV